ncbi:MAG: hypothetical protein R2764_02250 [Bacteroidales bacterium]
MIKGIAWLAKFVVKALVFIAFVASRPFAAPSRQLKTNPVWAKTMLTVVILNYVLWTLVIAMVFF